MVESGTVSNLHKLGHVESRALWIGYWNVALDLTILKAIHNKVYLHKVK